MTAIVQSENMGSNAPVRQIAWDYSKLREQRSLHSPVDVPSKRPVVGITKEQAYALSHIDYVKFRKIILNLNPRIGFRTISFAGRDTGKMAISVPTPSKAKIEEWGHLTHWEKRYVEAHRGSDGPAKEVVAVSRGHISPFVTLVSQGRPGHPTEVIARSGKTIIERLVQAQAFSWDEAERQFQIPWNKIETVSCVDTKWWEQDDEKQRQIVVVGG